MSIITLIGIIFAVYKIFADPDIKAASDILIMKKECELKHKNLDENIFLIKENHLRHIEIDISELKQTQVKILTILEERDKQK